MRADLRRASITILLCIAAIATAFCGPMKIARADQAAEDAHLADVRRMYTTAPDFTVWYSIERKAFALADGRAHRKGDVLTLVLANGGQSTFRSREDECRTGTDQRKCRIFWLEAYLPTRHFFVVHEGLYEGDQYLLVDDRTGKQTALSAEPRFGPDPDVVLVIDDDEAYGSGRELQVWRRKEGRAVLEWEWAPTDEPHHIDLVQWDDPPTVLLRMHSLESLNHPAREWPAILHRGQDGWHLDMVLGRH